MKYTPGMVGTPKIRPIFYLPVIATLIGVISTLLFLQFYVVPTGSMAPTVPASSTILATKNLPLSIKVGDIVVFEKPERWDITEEYVLKRVIGVGGDHLVGRSDGTVVRNGEILNEPYIYTPPNHEGAKVFDIKVPPGMLWVMGDNRALSADSRYYDNDTAFVDESLVVGTVIHITKP